MASEPFLQGREGAREREFGDAWVEPALYVLGAVIAVTLVSAVSVLLYLT